MQTAIDVIYESAYRKGRADAIDECIKIIMSYPTPYLLIKDIEQLKEKKEHG